MKAETVFRPYAFRVGARIALALMCATGVTGPVFAQGSREGENVHLRNDCRLAAQALQTGHPAPKTDWALQVIYWCDESGGPALQALWAAPTTDIVALEQLVKGSERLLDQRVYVAVMAKARDASAPRAVRIAALRVLSAFIANTTAIDQADLMAMPDSNVTRTFSSIDHGIPQFVGSQPLTLSARSDFLALLLELSRTDPDSVIRRAGRDLRRWFTGEL